MKKIFEYMQSGIGIALILAGIGGLSYELFREGGWIETLLGTLWNIGTRHTLIVIPVVIAAAILFNSRKRKGNAVHGVHGRSSRLPDMVLYTIMAAGAYYTARFFFF
jgi:hypothetical protein